MRSSTKKFLKKILIAIIAIIPGILGLFIGYNYGEIDTQIETIETLNGMQNIEADNVTINYYSDSNDYEEALAQIVSDVNDSIQKSENLIRENANLISINEDLTNKNSDLTSNDMPLSAAILVKTVDAHGYIVNSDYETLIGTGFEKSFIAKSGGITYDETISHQRLGDLDPHSVAKLKFFLLQTMEKKKSSPFPQPTSQKIFLLIFRMQKSSQFLFHFLIVIMYLTILISILTL